MRQYRSLILLVLAIFCGVGLAATLTARATATRGALNGTPTLNIPYRVPVMGINADLTQYTDDAELVDNIDLIVQGGFTWVRQEFSWADINPEPAQYNWNDYDRVVTAAEEAGIELVAVIVDAPGWAAASPAAEPDLDAAAVFAGALAARYGDSVDVYQIWDEPNLAAGWGNQPADPVAYMALLEAVYAPIHDADPGALVLTAGLAPTIETGPDNLSDVMYLDALYANGAAPFFDGVAAKPYGFDTDPDDRTTHPNVLNFSRMVLIREVMEAYGDTASPLWASHLGWNSLPADWTGDHSLWGQTDSISQANQTVQAYERALTEWPWAGALILDNWQADLDQPDSARWGFSLRAQDGELSPAYDALAGNAAGFNGVLWPGLYPAEIPQADYSGSWEFSELGADFSEDGSSVVSIPFTGDSLSVIARRGDYRAYLYVTVDGQPSDALPRDERGAYLVLTDPDYQPRIEVLGIANGRPDRTQTALIEADRGWDQWALVGFAVGHDLNTLPYDGGIAGLAVLMITLLVLAVWLGDGLRWREALDRFAVFLRNTVSETLHVILIVIAALAAWGGAVLTWGGLVPDVLRRLGDGPTLLVTALTAGVFYFSPWLLITLVALLVLFILIYVRPSMGLALTLFLTPYYLMPRPLFDRAFSMVEIVALLTFAAWAIQWVAARNEDGWPTLRDTWNALTPLDKALGLFVIAASLTLFWVDFLGVAVTDLRQMILQPLTIYIVLRTMPLTQPERWRIIDMLLLTGLIVSVIGFYQAVTGIDVITAEAGSRRLRSIFGTPNNAALFLGRLVPLAAAVALIGGDKRRRWTYGVIGILMIGAIVLTMSRGGLLLGLPAGVGLVLVLAWGKLGAWIVAVGAALLALALIPLTRLPRFANLVDFSEGSSFFRIQLWNSTLQLIRDHPLTGVGLDQFLYAYRGHYILPAAWQQPDLSQPHNVFLNYWVRLGLLGLIAGAWIQVAFWRMGFATQKLLKQRGDTERWAMTVGLLGAMAAFLAHGLVDETHFVIDLAYIFCMSLGLMHQLHEGALHEHSDRQHGS